MRSKTLALLLVAVIASGIVLAVSAQSQITAADIAKAILPGGIINPKAIAPGAITPDHLADPGSGAIFVGDGTGSAAAKTVSGDAVINGDGKVTIQKIQDKPISATDVTSGRILIANGTGWDSQDVSGDIDIDSNGIATIQNNAVDDTDLVGGAIPSWFNSSTTAMTDIAADTEIFNQSISLNRPAKLIIIFSGNATDVPAGNYLDIKAQIKTGGTAYDATPANYIRFADSTNYGTYSTATFYNTSVPAGDHYVLIVGNGNGAADLGARALTVIALPA